MPPNQNNGNNNGGYTPGLNNMQLQAGMMAPPIAPIMPMGPSPGDMSTRLQQQAMMMQYSTPHPSAVFGGSPLAMPGVFQPRVPQMGMGLGASARQNAIHTVNHDVGRAQSAAGLGMRGIGMAAAGMLGGPMGMLAYEALGIGGMMQDLGGSVMSPIVSQRQRALSFQNASTGWVTGGGALSATGQGMNMISAQQVTSGINRLADSGDFRRQTGGVFNRADLDRITRLSGELGMLDQSHTADQTIREVKKISKSLAAFMKIAGDPDLQNAMRQMAQLRQHGFGVSEMPLAASNARTFARMAGVSVDEAMSRASAGAGVFQQAGMSGAAGFNAGLGAMGAARQAIGGMNARQLSMAGGEAGVANTLLNASAQSASLAMMLPAVLTQGSPGGQMTVDRNALVEMTRSRSTISDFARRSAENIQRMGGRDAVGQILTRRGELQDEAAMAMSPEMLTMLPMLHARMIQREQRGSLAEAFQTMGHSEQDARTLAQTMQNPEFFQNMQQQMRVSSQERMASRRDVISARDSASARIGRSIERNITDPVNSLLSRAIDPITGYFAHHQDNEEALAMQGEGRARIIRGSDLGSRVQQAAAQDQLRRDPQSVLARANRALSGAAEGAQAENARDARNAQSLIARTFHGPDGFGFSRAGRGGDTLRSTILENAGLENRINEFFGRGPTAAQVTEMGNQQVELGALLEGRGGSYEEQSARRVAAARGMGMNDDRLADLRGAMAGAVTSYVQSTRTGPAGVDQAASADALRAHMVTSLQSRGFTEAEARAAANNTELVSSAAQTARHFANADDAAVIDQHINAGRQVRGQRAGQTLDQLRVQGNRHRAEAAVQITGGARGFSDSENRGLIELVAGDGDDAELRRKVLAASIMAESEDEDTKVRGIAELARLQQQAERDGKTDAYRRAVAAVEGQIDTMSASSRRELVSRYEGLSVEDANVRISGATESANQALGDDVGMAMIETLGEAGARAFGAGGREGVRALREVRDSVTDTNIRRMLDPDSGATTEQIEDAVTQATSRGIDAGSGPSAAGAGTSEEERQALGDTAAMIAAITEGMEDLPGAVTQLDRASRRLDLAARNIESAVRGERIVDAAGEGAGGEERGLGFYVQNLFTPMPRADGSRW